MKRPIIAGVAIAAAAVLAAGTITGFVAYSNATSDPPHAGSTSPTQTQVSDYRRMVLEWPYPFAPGDAVPKSPPTVVSGTPSTQNDRTFISFFYRCSWANEALNGKASSRAAALQSLEAWDRLPEGVSGTDNADGAWKATVLDPARSDNLQPLEKYFETCTPYKSFRTTPGAGLVVDRPLPDPSLTTTIPPITPAHVRAAVGADKVDKFQVEVPVDNGAENYATGTVTMDSSGRPAAYVVASGDVIDFIAHRFGFFSDSGQGFEYLNAINQVRRGGYPWTIYAGDTINLSAYTVLTVGSVNGKVLNEAPPVPLPPQH